MKIENFKELTKKLQKINFASNKNLKILDSESMKYLIKQRDILDKPENVVGTCCLTSIFDAYPKLFDYDIHNLKKDLINLNNDRQYKEIDSVIEYFNSKYQFAHGNIMHKVKFVKSDYMHNAIKESINNGLPVVYYVNFHNDNAYKNHAITILGYDDYEYYAFENAYDNPILSDISLTKTLDILYKRRTVETKAQADILKADIKTNEDLVKVLSELQQQIIIDDTIFKNYGKFFRFDAKYLYNWYGEFRLGLIVLNDSIKELQVEELDYSYKYRDIIGGVTLSKEELYVYFSKVLSNYDDVRNLKILRLNKELGIPKEELKRLLDEYDYIKRTTV